MYPESAQVVDTPTRRKSIAPRPTHGGEPRSRATAVDVVPGASQSHKSENSQSDAVSDAGESLERPVPRVVPVHAVPEAVEPLLLPCPASEQAPGAVAVEAAGCPG